MGWRRLKLAGLAVCAAFAPLVTATVASAEAGSEGPTRAVVGAQQQDHGSGVEVVRWSGRDHYELSVHVAEGLAVASGGRSEWVVLVSGESWADAALAGPLAAGMGAPVVLLPPDGLQTPEARPEFVSLLRSAGVRRAVIVGSPETVPHHEPSVLYGTGMLPRNVERVFGSDRLGTAIAVAERLGVPAEMSGFGRTVILASDQSLADAEAAGPLGAAGPFPMLLTASDVLDPRLAAYLVQHEVEHVVLVGGTSAIAPGVQEAIEAVDVAVTRLAGRDRLETSRLAADLFEQHIAGDPDCQGAPTGVGLVPAADPRQALTASPLLARLCTSLRYVPPGGLPHDLHNSLYLVARSQAAVQLHLFGSPSAIPDDAVDLAFPPTRLVFVQVLRGETDGMLRTQLAVVDEQGAVRSYPQTAVEITSWRSESPRQFCWIRDLRWSPSSRFLSYRQDCDPGIHVLDTETGDAYEVVHEHYDLDFLGLTWYDDDWYWYTGRVGPRWSPVEERFAFAAVIDDPATEGIAWGGHPVSYAELFVHDATARSTRRLTNNARHDLVGTWSPDGKLLATSWHWEPAATDPYYRVAVHSSLLESDTGRFPVSGFGPTWATSLRWSADGSYFAFRGGDGWWTDQAVVMKSDGSAIQWLTPVGCEECYDEGGKHPGAFLLGWSPTGTQLAFGDSNYITVEGESDYSNQTTAHYIFDVATNQTTSIHEYTSVDWGDPPLRFIAWARDGKSLLYSTYGEEASDPRRIVRIDRDGAATPLRDIPPLSQIDGEPRRARPYISPDQSQLALVYDRAAAPEERYDSRSNRHDLGMWLIDMEPSDPRQLIDFRKIDSHDEDSSFAPASATYPERNWYWGCRLGWTDIGILGTCEYR